MTCWIGRMLFWVLSVVGVGVREVEDGCERTATHGRRLACSRCCRAESR